MNENLGRENHLPQQIFPPLLLRIPQSLQTTMMEGRGEEKHFCDLVGVSIQRNGEISSLIAFVSTNFVEDCSICFSNANLEKKQRIVLNPANF